MSATLRGLRQLAVLTVFLQANAALAEEAPPPSPPPTYRVDFQAARVEIEPETFELKLQGNVVVTVARYRIESQRLSLTRGPRGLEVDGAGEVALCACESAPVTLGFQSATVAPPTDLLLSQPTLRLGGVPVLWLPYLWLRARDRLGFLPPWVEWRGEDGLLIGGGTHVPLGGRSARGRFSAFDLRAAAYLEGGVRADGLLETESTHTRVVWDHLDESALRVDAQGAAATGDGAVTAWSADLLRGPRGREYPSSLDLAARRYDRLAFSVGHARSWVAGLGLEGTAVRGGPVDELGAFGPTLHVGGGGPLGQGSSADASLSVVSLRSGEGSQSAMSGDALLELEAPSAPLSIGATLRNRARAVTFASAAEASLTTGVFPRVALPLVRQYSVFSHWLEPSVFAAELLSATTPRPTLERPALPRPATLADGGQSSYLLGAGLDNALGTSRTALELGVRAGFVGGETLEPAVAAEVASDLELASLSVTGTAEDDRGSLVGQARLGAADGLHLAGRVEAASDGGSSAARWLLPDAWDSPAPLLEERGVGVAADLDIPWSRMFRTEIGAELDASASEVLAVYSEVAYQHPCRCVGATAWVGQRVGRDGFDAWLSVDLAP